MATQKAPSRSELKDYVKQISKVVEKNGNRLGEIDKETLPPELVKFLADCDIKDENGKFNINTVMHCVKQAENTEDNKLLAKLLLALILLLLFLLLPAVAPGIFAAVTHIFTADILKPIKQAVDYLLPNEFGKAGSAVDFVFDKLDFAGLKVLHDTIGNAIPAAIHGLGVKDYEYAVAGVAAAGAAGLAGAAAYRGAQRYQENKEFKNPNEAANTTAQGQNRPQGRGDVRQTHNSVSNGPAFPLPLSEAGYKESRLLLGKAENLNSRHKYGYYSKAGEEGKVTVALDSNGKVVSVGVSDGASRKHLSEVLEKLVSEDKLTKEEKNSILTKYNQPGQEIEMQNFSTSTNTNR